MWVLHALAGSDRLLVWVEDSELPPRVSGRAPSGPVAHPFSVLSADLRERLPLQAPEESTVLLHLPSYPSAPMPSPELVRDPLTAGSKPRGKLRLGRWFVPVLGCDPAEVRALLETELPGCRLGADARFVLDVAEFAEDLVDAGRVLPGLVDEDDRLAARWCAALSGADSAKFVALRESMPPALRARHGGTPDDVLRDLLDLLADGMVRHRLDGMRLSRGSGPAATWLNALAGDPHLPEERRFGELFSQLEQWHSGMARQDPVRTCFRLHPPEDDDEDWVVEFLLQAIDDPSVLISAHEVWHGEGHVLRRWVAEPQELLLADLGRAGRILPELDRALRAAQPTELVLDTEGAHSFLTGATALDHAGFGVLLPSWWGRTAQVGLKLKAESPGTAGVVSKDSAVNMNSLIDYKWELAIGEDTLTAAELEELAAAKVPLVRVRGRWVQVDQKRLHTGLKMLSETGRMTAAEVLQHAGESEDDPARPPVIGVNATGWLGDLLAGDTEQYLEPVDPPEDFQAELRPYQRRGLAWLTFLARLGLGGCLADDMGLGKTVQLLALEALTRRESAKAPTLLVCPMSVVGNWQREAERFAPSLRVHVHHGVDRLSGEDLGDEADRYDLVITTYPLAARDVAALRQVRWERLVLDEAQHVKNSSSKTARAIREIGARQRIALTGTPVENRLAELWSIMDFANPGVLGSLSRFRARYAVPIERENDTAAAAKLRQVTGPFILRRTKTDPTIIDDLPEKIEMKQLCNLTTEQASLYRAVVDDMLQRIEQSEGMERKGLVLATMSKLKQVCNHPAQFLGDGTPLPGRSGKLQRLEEILEGVLADGEKALVFTQFAGFGGALVPHLSARFDAEVLFLHGGTNKATRDAMVRRFQDPEGPSIFILSLKAGGTGLNLTAANHVVHLDRWWNPAVEDQATDRAFRIGQRKDVQVRKLSCIGTLEEKIDLMISEKKALAQLVVASGENWLTELSTTELRELVTLDAEAVGE